MSRLSSIREALAQSPENISLLLLFARECMEEMRMDEAAEAFEEALRLDPAQADAHLGLGRILYLQGDLSGAAVRAERVLHLAAWQEYVLEFSDAQTAQRALAQLRTDPNVTDCFLDETFSAEETLSGLWDETPSYSWGGRTMGFTTLRHQA